jgi:hypothetical protein
MQAAIHFSLLARLSFLQSPRALQTGEGRAFSFKNGAGPPV